MDRIKSYRNYKKIVKGEGLKQQLFLQFMELINSIHDILYNLSISGHPSYQDCQLIIPGSESIENLTKMLDHKV